MKVPSIARRLIVERRVTLVAIVVIAIWMLLAFGAVEPESWPALRRSAELGLCAAAGATPIGIVLAFLLTRTDIPLRRTLIAATALMLFAPIYLQAAAWEAGFGKQGWYTLMNDQVETPLLSGWRAAVWIHIAAAVPWVTLIVSAGLRYIDPEQEEAALLDGGAAAAFCYVTTPQVATSIGVAATWVFITTSQEMTVADLFFIKTYARELYNGFGFGDTLGASWNNAKPGFLMTSLLAVGAAVCLSWAAPTGRQNSARPAARWRLESARIPVAILAVLLVLAFTATPLCSLCLKAGWMVESVGEVRVRSWSLARFVETAAGSLTKFHRELKWSLAIGAIAATATLSLAGPLAWFARRGGIGALPLVSASAIAIATPGPLLGMMIVMLFSRDLGWLNVVYDRSLFAPVVLVAFRALPYAGALCWFAFRSIDTQVIECSQLDGAGQASSFLRIAAPLRSSAMAAAWFVGFAIASGDLAGTILVEPPGVTTAAVRVFSLIHSGVGRQESALCLASMGVYLVAAGSAWWLFQRVLVSR